MFRKVVARILSMLVVGVLLFVCSATASEIMPLADSEFNTATPTLYSSKKVNFQCATYYTKNSISVTACWLEQKVDGEWEYVCALTPPTKVVYNTFALSVTVDYSSEIGSGTYRVWGTFNADGHEISRCSNERTFD